MLSLSSSSSKTQRTWLDDVTKKMYFTRNSTERASAWHLSGRGCRMSWCHQLWYTTNTLVPVRSVVRRTRTNERTTTGMFEFPHAAVFWFQTWGDKQEVWTASATADFWFDWTPPDDWLTKVVQFKCLTEQISSDSSNLRDMLRLNDFVGGIGRNGI